MNAARRCAENRYKLTRRKKRRHAKGVFRTRGAIVFSLCVFGPIVGGQCARRGRPMNVGLIGLGQMGAAMAQNLIKAGHRVAVYNRTRAKAEALAAAGGIAAATVGEACGNEAVITMLSDDDAVTEAVFADGAMLANLPRGAVHVSMSTISAALSERLTEAHRKAGQAYVAAPVFGRPEAAASAKLFIVAAGEEDTISRLKPLFDAMGQKTFVVGSKPSEANVVKLSGNFLLASIIESLGEAFALIRKSGIDPHRYSDILGSTLLSAPVYKTYVGLIADAKYEPAGFKMSRGLKDVRLALAAADSLRCRPVGGMTPVATAKAAAWVRFMQRSLWRAVSR